MSLLRMMNRDDFLWFVLWPQFAYWGGVFVGAWGW